MSDPIFSPDGQFMWTGSEWIPAPPTSMQSTNPGINLEDSMRIDDLNIDQGSPHISIPINLKDSAMSGDVNITQNNIEDITTAMLQILERMGFTGQSSPAKLTPSQEEEVEQVLEISEQLAGHGIEIDPLTEVILGNAAMSADNFVLAQIHYQRALDTFRERGNRSGERKPLCKLIRIAILREDINEKERLLQELLPLNKEIGDSLEESNTLFGLGKIAKFRGDYTLADRLYRESLSTLHQFDAIGAEVSSLEILESVAEEEQKNQLRLVEDELRNLKPEYISARDSGNRTKLRELRPVLESMMEKREVLLCGAREKSEFDQLQDKYFVRFVQYVDSLIGKHFSEEVIDELSVKYGFTKYREVLSKPGGNSKDLRSGFFKFVEKILIGHLPDTELEKITQSADFSIYRGFTQKHQQIELAPGTPEWALDHRIEEDDSVEWALHKDGTWWYRDLQLNWYDVDLGWIQCE